MPIPPVAGEPRGFQAEHGADRSLTQLRHQRFEAGARHQPAGGPPQVIIDRHDVTEAVRLREVLQL